MSLFYETIQRGRVPNLHGSITLALPLSWSVLSATLSGFAVAIVLLLAFTTHAKTATAQGEVLPSTGILKIFPARAGRVEAVFVVEGQEVKAGQMLAGVSAGEVGQNGLDAQTDVLTALEQRKSSIEKQSAMVRQAAVSEQQGLANQIFGFRSELKTIDAQLQAQRSLVDMASSDLTSARQVAERGFFSRRDLATREEAVLTRGQQLSSLNQARAAKVASLGQALASARQATARVAGEVAALSDQRAQLDRERAVINAGQGFNLVAPRDGKVAVLTIHPGDTVSPGEAAMLVVPRGGALIARLLVPASESGFLSAGERVRFALNAFPFDRFGTLGGTVKTVSAAPITQKTESGSEQTYYVAVASIDQSFVATPAGRRNLLPGMTFTARIQLERRSLLQWIFGPIFRQLAL